VAPVMKELQETREQLAAAAQAQNEQRQLIEQLRDTLAAQTSVIDELRENDHQQGDLQQKRIEDLRQELSATLRVQEEKRQQEADRDRDVIHAIRDRLEKKRKWWQR
jgi:hypothetical protein